MCNVSYKRIIIVSLTIISIVLFSCSFNLQVFAAEDDDLEYIIASSDIFYVFPEYNDYAPPWSNYSEFYYEESGETWRTPNQYVNEDGDWRYIISGRHPDEYCSWAYMQVNFPPEDKIFDVNDNYTFRPGKIYYFDFYIKFGGIEGSISYGEAFDILSIQYTDPDYYYEPVEFFVEGNHYVAHFNFMLSGDEITYGETFPFRFWFEDERNVQALIRIWFPYGKLFTVRTASESEIAADNIANIGSNIPPVDTSNVTGGLDDTTAALDSIDEEYQIDQSSTSQALSYGAGLFKSNEYQSAAYYLKYWISKFIQDNALISAMISACLGLGLAFYAIGRGGT